MLLAASSWSVCREFKFEILLCTNPTGTDAPRGCVQGHGDLGLVNTRGASDNRAYKHPPWVREGSITWLQSEKFEGNLMVAPQTSALENSLLHVY